MQIKLSELWSARIIVPPPGIKPQPFSDAWYRRVLHRIFNPDLHGRKGSDTVGSGSPTPVFIFQCNTFKKLSVHDIKAVD